MRRYYFFAFLALGILGCNKDSANKEICIIQNLTVTIGECSGDSTYALTIGFDVENAGNSSFDVFIRNNEFVGNYPLSSLPLTINDFRKSGKDEDFIKICINDNADCCAAAEFSPPACEVPTCSISNLVLTQGECTSDSTYSMTIDFNVQNPSNASFDVLVRNNVAVGYFPLSSLPVTISNFPISGLSEDYVKVRINDNADCFLAKEIPSKSCEASTCSISNLVLSQGECTSDSTYSMTIDFDVQNTTNGSFDVFIRNNVAIGFFPISSLPVTIPDFPISGKDYDYVKVCINDNNSCCKAEEILSKNCE